MNMSLGSKASYYFKTCKSVTHSVVSVHNPLNCSPSGSPVHGILQARILEWVAIPFSRGSSWPRDQTWVSHITGRFFTVWVTREDSKHIRWVSNAVSKCNHSHGILALLQHDKSCFGTCSKKKNLLLFGDTCFNLHGLMTKSEVYTGRGIIYPEEKKVIKC